MLAGLIAAHPSGHVMIVDDDDFVSRRLADHVARNPQANGWFIRKGYIWSDGGSLVLRHNSFSHICGTSHIIRADLYAIPDRFDAASPEYIQKMLGDHIYRNCRRTRRSRTYAADAIAVPRYRLPHRTCGSSESKSIWQTFFDHSHGIGSVLRNTLKLGYLSPRMRREFFAAQV